MRLTREREMQKLKKKCPQNVSKSNLSKHEFIYFYCPRAQSKLESRKTFVLHFVTFRFSKRIKRQKWSQHRTLSNIDTRSRNKVQVQEVGTIPKKKVNNLHTLYVGIRSFLSYSQEVGMSKPTKRIKSRVVQSTPSIQRPQVRIPSTPSMLLQNFLDTIILSLNTEK